MILVTGTSGFIGKHLLQALVNKYGAESVLAFTSVPPECDCPYLLHNGYEFDADYFVKSGYGSIHTIVHAGAFIPKSMAFANSWDACSSNISNTQRLLSAVLPELRKVVFLSTIDVYGTAELISENTPVQPYSLYGHSKYYCEQMLTAWAGQTGKTVNILRIGHVYGPGEEAYEKIIPVLIRKMQRREPLKLVGNGVEIRSFIYVTDVVDAVLTACVKDISGGPVNIAGAEGVSIRELVDRLLVFAGYEPEIENLPLTAAPRNIRFDTTRMAALFGPEKMTLAKGLELEWAHMKELI